MHRNTLPSSSACILPEGVNSPPHFKIRSKDASFGASENLDLQLHKLGNRYLLRVHKHGNSKQNVLKLPSSELEFLGLPLG